MWESVLVSSSLFGLLFHFEIPRYILEGKAHGGLWPPMLGLAQRRAGVPFGVPAAEPLDSTSTNVFHPLLHNLLIF